MSGDEPRAVALYPAEIPVVARLVDGGPVPVPHTGQACYSHDDRGRQWVRKRDLNTGTEEVLAEAIGCLLARRLNAPVPDAAFFKSPEGLSWLSSRVDPALHWDARHVSKIVNLDGLGAILALDALVMNHDRHGRNLLLQPLDDGRLKVWAIDQGQSLVGWPDDFRNGVDQTPATKSLAPGIPFDLLVEGALKAARAAEDLARGEILAMVRGACLMTGEPKADVIGETLATRCSRAVALVETYVKSAREASR